MPTNKTKDTKQTRLPWLQENPELDKAVSRVVNEFKNTKTQKREPAEIDGKTEQHLLRRLKDAEQGRSKAGKFMLALAKGMEVEDPETSYVVAGMKSWDRIVNKFNAAARDVNDLGRGAVYINSVDEYKAFQRIMRSKTKDGEVRQLNAKGVHIIDGSMDDYIASPRKSGYAGSINFNIDLDIGKGRHGVFEVQIRPKAYQDIDKKSHYLYDMIRILQEVPQSFLTDGDKEVRDSLITANRALFEEHSLRHGFDEVRKGEPLQISAAEMRSITGILDRLRTAIESLPGHGSKWQSESADALTYAKTSVVNVHMSCPLKSDPSIDLG